MNVGGNVTGTRIWLLLENGNRLHLELFFPSLQVTTLTLKLDLPPSRVLATLAKIGLACFDKRAVSYDRFRAGFLGKSPPGGQMQFGWTNHPA
jgi:hypothetical protein